MPLYEYRCTQCGHRFEKIQSFSDEPETECPECHGPLIRPLTAPALQFKGAGWYVNDYASKSSQSASDSAPTEAKAAGDSKAPAESKAPAPKTESAPSTPASTPAASSGSSTSSSNT